MSRPLAQQFNCKPLADLTRQLLIAPSQKRIEQVRRAETLHDEIDALRNYPFDFINWRITAYRSESEEVTLVGEALLPDLRLLIDKLSRSVGMPKSESVQTSQQLARQCNVSTKTVDRWRKLGLRWRWTQAPSGGRKKLVFTKQAVKWFLKRHVERVERAGRFSQMGDPLRAQLLDRARQLAAQQRMSQYRAACLLARETGRAVETLRLLLEQYDRDHPETKIFANHTGPLTPRQKQVVVRAYRKGVPVSQIAARFQRTKVTVHRVLRERRIAELRRLKIEYVHSPTFNRDDADEVLLRPEPPITTPPEAPFGLDNALEELPEQLRGLYSAPLTPLDHITGWLVRMNYLKFKAEHIRDHLDRYHPSVFDMNKIESHLNQAAACHQTLVRANLYRVLLVARQHLSAAGPDSAGRMIDLLEIGNHELIAAVRNFDFTQRQSFVPYLTWVLKRRFARYEPGSDKAHRRLTGTMMLQRLCDAALRGSMDLKSERGGGV